ncbi:MAG: phage late control D family protein, partial [Betaproteobacteria bacterium]|nr:phage late control D family protein [Betaproteobacteria bacterium]
MDFSCLKEVKNSVSGLNPLEKLSAMLPESPFESLEAMLADFASAFTQGNRLFTLQVGDGTTFGDRLLPQSVEGTESLSKCYKVEVICLSPDAFIPLKSLLGQAAQLDILTGMGGGLPGLGADNDATDNVTRCGLITQAQMLPSDGGFAKYQLTIEPPVALLRHRVTSRVFQDLSVPEIVEQVLNEHINANKAIGGALKLKLDLMRQYAPRSYCLQYRETDLAFIERLLFEEGLPYRFEFEGGQAPCVTFIVFDDPFGLPQSSQKTIRFHRAEATEKEDSLTDWQQARQIGSGSTTLASFDYKPVLTNETGAEGCIEQGEEGLEAESTLEDYEPQTLYYGTDSEELNRYASRRQESHDWAKMSCRGEGNVRQLQAGQWFSLTGHPYYDRFNAQEEREFVVCKAKFIAHNNLPQSLTNRLTASGSPFDTGGSPRAATPTTNWANVSVGDAAFGVP